MIKTTIQNIKRQQTVKQKQYVTTETTSLRQRTTSKKRSKTATESETTIRARDQHGWRHQASVDISSLTTTTLKAADDKENGNDVQA